MMRTLYTISIILLTLPLLQGCFPVIAGGVGAGALMASDRRTSGVYIEDEGIELKSLQRINEKLKNQVHVNVTSYNLSVLITGEAQNEALRSEVESIVKTVPNVRQVFNELVIAAPSSYSARSSDSYITTKVKARMVEANKFSPNHVKVVTEGGTVFLMGIVTRQEAAEATEIARTTSGVLKVVKLFEYLD